MSIFNPTQEEIDRCLNCDKPKCVDCVMVDYVGNAKTRRKWTDEEIAMMLDLNNQVTYLAKTLNCTRQTVRNQRKKHGVFGGAE